MQKKIWLSAFNCPEETVQAVMAKMKTYGLATDGHFFTDDTEKMAWAAPRKEILDTSVSMWLICCSAESLELASFRYGLSMLALAVQAERGAGFPIAIIQLGDESIDTDSLPTPLAGAKVFPLAADAYAAKVIAAIHSPVPQITREFRLDTYGIPNVGQWFEIGPADSTWKGVIFAVSDGEIKLQAVGPAGQLPEKSVLNYPQQGLEIAVGETTFIAWAVQNELPPDSSYYVKVEGTPEKIMFCPYSSEEETEAFILALR